MNVPGPPPAAAPEAPAAVTAAESLRSAERRSRERLERAIDAAAMDRLRVIAVGVSVALAAIAVVVAIVTGLPDALYYHALMLLFSASVWTQYALAKRFGPVRWHPFAFAALNFTLMAFTLGWPNPYAEIAQHPNAAQLMLRFGNFVYFFVLLAALALTFSPALVLWGGVCGATAWSLLRLWVALLPETEAEIDPEGQGDVISAVNRFLEPAHMDVGIWLQEVAALLITAGLLALAVQGSRDLVMRQAALERRGAALARYVPASVAERMAESDEPFVGDRAPPAAILFTDVVGFTGWAEERPPEEVMRLLRGVHALVGEEVFRTGGVLDKFIGDGAMATFGVAPGRVGEGVPDAEAAACRALDCAHGILARAADFNLEREERGEDVVRLSVGVHFGPVLVGDVGGAGRMELSVVGDTVNVASRLEALTRPLGCGAAASDAAMQAAGGAKEGWRRRGRRVLAGRHGGVVVWTLDHRADDPARPEGGPEAD